MSIRQLSLNHFRNLQSTTLDLHKNLNIITGLNASGKTSFIEALHIICQGRSFKTSFLNQCIQHNNYSFLLFALFENYKAGISRSQKNTIIRIDNKTIQQISILAKKTPVKVINASSLDLVLGAPVNKREFIDWCLFHVEHNYHALWLEHKHALKQRNALLKRRKNLTELDYWDVHISELCYKIYNLRKKYFHYITEIFNEEFPEFTNELPIELVYDPGWDINEYLIDILKKQRDKDIKYGFTRYGIHRDDLKIINNGLMVKYSFSRGQIKKISILLFIAQMIVINKFTKKKIILLIDDIDSELDINSVDYILKKLSYLNTQIFITSIQFNSDMVKYHEEYKLFHVEHGMIKAVKHT